MSGSEKLRARKRAVEAQRRANEKRANLERANVDDAASVRVLLQRLRAVDAWESVRLDQVNENVRMDAARKRVSHFVNLQTVTGRMRDRGQTIASIATLAEVEVRDLQNVLRRARADEGGAQRATESRNAAALSANGASLVSHSAIGVDHHQPIAADNYPTSDPNRCVRCDAVMVVQRRRRGVKDPGQRPAQAAEQSMPLGPGEGVRVAIALTRAAETPRRRVQQHSGTENRFASSRFLVLPSEVHRVHSNTAPPLR